MAYKVHLKKTEGNEISNILNTGVKEFTVETLTITNGLIYKGNKAIPIQSILFVEEV
jgi:hypothetical protein